MVHGHHDGKHGGSAGVSRFDERCVRALAQRNRLFEMAGPPCGLSEVLKIVPGELPVLVRLPQELVHIAPCMPACGFSAGFEGVVDDLRHWPVTLYAGSARIKDAEALAGAFDQFNSEAVHRRKSNHGGVTPNPAERRRGLA